MHSHSTLFQPDRLRTQLFDQTKAVAHHHDGAPFAPKLFDLFARLSLEALVSDREDLVDEQGARVDVRGDGKAEPHHHSRGVVLDGRVDEFAKLSEVNYCIKLCSHVIA